MRQPLETSVQANGHTFTVYEWVEAQVNKPSVIFFHATGFHARCWDAVIHQLEGVHCYAVDARGHGKSDKPAPPYTWQAVGEDTAAIVRALGLRDAVGVGHSMGGNSLVRAAAVVPEAFSELMLVDPVIFPKEQYLLKDYSIEGHFILNRKQEWHSAEEMFERFDGREPFKGWDTQVLRDYCEYAMLPDGNGYRLACPPEVEAHIYASGRLAVNADIWEAIEKVTQPVTVLRADIGVTTSANDLMRSPTAPDLAQHFQNGRDVPLPENTHFIPMESPKLVADTILELLFGV